MFVQFHKADVVIMWLLIIYDCRVGFNQCCDEWRCYCA